VTSRAGEPLAKRSRGLRTTAKAALGLLVGSFEPARERLPLSSWRLDRTPAGSLSLDGLELADLFARWGSPLQVVDGERLADNARRFSAGSPGRMVPPEVFASYKTNPVPEVLRRLHAVGLGAEVVSPYELWLALRLGVHPRAIVYNGPAKSEDSLVEALRVGVGLINVNARSELAPLAALARRLGVRPQVGIRVVPPGRWGGQFGERVDTGAALHAFAEAGALPELRVVGVHAHPGGELSTAAEVDAFVAGVLGFTDQLRARLGLEPEILDLGGNLACPTSSKLSPLARRLAVTFGREPAPRPPASVLDIEGYVAGVMGRVERHHAAAGRAAPRIFLEPGRALTGNAQFLLTRVVQVRDRDETGLTWAVLDAGINVAEPVRSEWHQLLPLRHPPGDRLHRYRLVGPSCMQGDLLYPAWALPGISSGDGLAIMDSGAYFVPFSTDFSFPRPPVVLLEGGRELLLRRGETFQDLVALDEGTPADGGGG
jgi:diaminopimelate decarboxylase